MDILLLPDEMLASVLKYSAFKDLTKLRKVSSKVDSVVKRHNMTRVKMNTLRFTKVDDDISVLLSDKETNTSYFQRHPSQTVENVLKWYLPKVRDLKCLQIYNSEAFGEDESSLSTEVAELILGKSCKKITSLDIEHFDLTMSIDQMRNILTNLKLNEVSIYSPFSNFELSDELVEGLECDSLMLLNTKNDSKVSLSCLDKICARKLPHSMVCEIHNVTASQLGQFFERHLTDDLAKTVNWTLDVDIGSMAKDELRPYFTGLKCFKNLSVGVFCATDKKIELTVFTDNNPWDQRIQITVHL